MRAVETLAERIYREAIEEALAQLDSGEINTDSNSGEMCAWVVLHDVLDEVERMPDAEKEAA